MSLDYDVTPDIDEGMECPWCGEDKEDCDCE